jgi:hypothetical protein
MKVDKQQFDAVLKNLIATPPKPVTPARKKRASRAKRKISQ